MHNYDRFIPHRESHLPEDGNGETGDEYTRYESPLDEMHELELAAELQELSNEAEFGRWLGKVFSKVRGVGRKFVQSPEGQRLRNDLRQSGRRLLKSGFQNASQYVGRNVQDRIPDADTGYHANQTIQSLGNWGNNAAVDNWGLDPGYDNPQYGYTDGNEVARQYTRFAAETANRYFNNPYRGQYPELARRMAFNQSARRFMPSLLSGSQQQGQWYRKGPYLVVKL
ncbi:MAG: hypothetical protein R2791_06310 [Saprospiraceae bacterium]